MPTTNLNEHEFELVNIVGSQLAANQRDLSRQMNLSLGMTNMLMRRLVTKGYIRIKQLNQRKVKYILTPKGFAEKMRKSVHYTLKTINSIGLIKKHLSKILGSLYQEGERKFYILGESDLAALIEIVLREQCQHDYTVVHIKDRIQATGEGVILVCTDQQANGSSPTAFKEINLIENLAYHV
ncbi:MAG: winged helix-turn-helix transcriptional regulator [Candidatus Omnitrophica bacterium]|nr:winged helix-turn-helix transcriptional regulator [Candidatus Omnitrophota bacterium]